MSFRYIFKFNKIRSPIKKKILLLLLGNVSLGLAYSPRKQIKVLKQVAKEWQKINRQALVRNLRELYDYGCIDWREKPDGVCEVIITRKGKSITKALDVDNLKIDKPKQWDKKWRIVFFDIPEKKKRARNALREKLRDLGFCEMQKSIFAFPYECQDEINFIINLFGIKSYVQYAEMIKTTNELELRSFFRFL